MVIQPSDWKNFRASIDWYSIDVNGFIGREFGSTQGKINQCFNNTVGTGGACAGITRTASGDLVVTNIHFVNLGSIETSGVDVAADMKFSADDFGLDPSWGTLGVHLLGTWVDYFDISGGDVVGSATEAGTVPEYGASATFTYSVGDWKLYWAWQYIDNVTECGGYCIRMPGMQYNNVSAEWNLSDHVQFYGGVNNVWDEEPPIFENGNSNTDTARYDIVGRTYFLGATIRY
jgi:iron complex outermembrane receptor protein